MDTDIKIQFKYVADILNLNILYATKSIHHHVFREHGDGLNVLHSEKKICQID